MKESLVNRLRAVRIELKENINVDDRFWMRLIETGTFTNEHVQLCKVKSKVEGIELLLDMLERRDDSCFDQFCKVLRVHNLDLVKKYLDVYPDIGPPKSMTQKETGEELSGSNIVDHLQNLRDANASLLKLLDEEMVAYGCLETINTDMQNKLEEAKAKVTNLDLQHQKNEENYENNVKDLEDEKSLITKLEKERELLEEDISLLKADLGDKNESKRRLEEELSGKTQENRKLGKQVSFHKTHLSSLGS